MHDSVIETGASESNAACCVTRSAPRRLALLLCCGLLAACKIEPAKGRYACSDGIRCPPGLSCGPDSICHAQGFVFDAGGDISPGQSILPDGALPDGSSSPEGGAAVGSSRGDAQACNGACTGNRPVCFEGACVECMPGVSSCEGNTPVLCTVRGRRSVGASCAGETPVCSRGGCFAMRLVSGFLSVGRVAAQSADIRVVEDSFEWSDRVCGATSNQEVCVVGGITALP